MNKKIVAISLVIVFSTGCILFALFLILIPHYAVGYGGRVSRVSVRHPFFLIPASVGVLGWLITGYEIFALKQKSIIGPLRKRMLREGFDKSVYRIFSGRGGVRRLAIMQSLDTPKLRNEISNITNTDWKEVDRNVKILESASLVKTQFSHGSLSVYELTEEGKELLGIIQSELNIDFSTKSITQS